MFILRIISAFLSLYSLLCLLRIIITWIPNYSYSKPADILAQICDPYMNLFRGIKSPDDSGNDSWNFLFNSVIAHFLFNNPFCNTAHFDNDKQRFVQHKRIHGKSD